MKKILTILHILFVVGLFYTQTPTASENYIYAKTYLSEDGSKKSETVQYFDGLGRLKQTVSVKSTSSGKDLVVPTFYDELGRQPKDFLPLPMMTANSGIQSVSEADVNSYYGVANAFSEKIFDNSPLAKVLETAAPGDAWKKGSGHTVKLQYETNVSADQVKNYVITSAWADATLSSSVPTVQWYSESQLMKNITIDEDGNKSIVFKNSQGQNVLVRKMNGTTPIDTYYIYNLYDQLAYVITPKADAQISQNGNVVTQAILNDFCYQYKYDNRNRLVEKRLPGKNSWEYYVYDKQNRQVLSQDANQNRKQWSFIKYDKFGRVVYTGLFANTSNRVSMQTAINSMASNALNNESRSSTPFLANGQNVYYTNLAFPTGSLTIHSVNYYDDYAPGAPSVPSAILGAPTLNASPIQYSFNGVVSYRSTKDMPTSSYVKNIEDDNWTASHIWYDTKGRTIGSHSINHLGGYTKVESELDFAGTLLQNKTFHKRLNTDIEKVITETFEYDSQNRLLIHRHQIDSNPVEVLSQNTYNDINQLEVKKIGNTISSPLQTVNYNYNIHGKLIRINDPDNLGDDLFGYKINYNQVEGLETPNSDFIDLKVKAKYNGNIAEVAWKTLTEANEPLKRYGYVYDNLNRLTAGFYQKAGVETAREYFEKIDYDIDGSIVRLKRSEGLQSGNTIAMVIDNLKYDYTGNRLTKVTDEQQNPSGYPYLTTPNTITYDANGNITSHLDRGISSIQYNFLNLPKQVTQNARLTTYTYRADGVKVKKLFGDLETNYLDGFQYKSTKPSEAVPPGGITPEPDPNEIPEIKLRIIPTSEGYYDALNNQYVYNFTDHLGNVRLSYTDTNKDGIIQPRQYSISACSGTYNPPFELPTCINEWRPGEIVENNSYYPFGLLHNYTVTTQNPYQYKFNGKELQESGMYDFGARFYMPDLGRWGVIDPLAESYRRWSPYHYAMNNPINLNDPDGMGSYDSEGVWHSEMEDFNNYHNLDFRSPDEREYNTLSTGESEGLDGGGGSSGIANDGCCKQFFDKLKKQAGDFFDKAAGTFQQQFGVKGMLDGYMYWEGDDGFTYAVVNDKFYKITTDAFVPVNTLPPMNPIAAEYGTSKFIWGGTGSNASKGLAIMGSAGKANVLVYLSLNAQKLVQYVGITNNFALRSLQHMSSKGIIIREIEGLANLTRQEAKAVEQVLIESYGLGGKAGQTGQLMNRINSISKKNPVYGESLKVGKNLLEKVGFKF